MAVTGTIVIQPQQWDAYAAGLRQLGPRLAKKAVGQALRVGAKIIQQEAEARVPVDTGALRQSIRVRVGKVRGKKEIKIIIITGKDDNAFSGSEYYGAFIEFGYRRGKRTAGQRGLQRLKGDIDKHIEGVQRYLRNPFGRGRNKRKAKNRLKYLLDVKSGVISDTRTQVPARPYMRPAFDHKKDEAAAAIGVQLGMSIEAEWRRLMA